MFLKLYLVALPVFFVIDMVWLGLVAKTFYKKQLGFLMRSDFVGGVIVLPRHVAILLLRKAPKESNQIVFVNRKSGLHLLATPIAPGRLSELFPLFKLEMCLMENASRCPRQILRGERI